MSSKRNRRIVRGLRRGREELPLRGVRRLQGFAEKVLGNNEPQEPAFVAQGLLWFVGRVSIPRN